MLPNWASLHYASCTVHYSATRIDQCLNHVQHTEFPSCTVELTFMITSILPFALDICPLSLCLMYLCWHCMVYRSGAACAWQHIYLSLQPELSFRGSEICVLLYHAKIFVASLDILHFLCIFTARPRLHGDIRRDFSYHAHGDTQIS